MPGGRERNIIRWELRATLLRDQIARLNERLARLDATDVPSSKGQREALLAERAELARQLDALGPDPRAKMG
ncbi:MAG TPA: hypothetical protein VFQ32_05115 [Ktedonobacterales bacterium]|nr:hypothetical protein [Ktedonobacterales bacterium]